MGLESPGEKPNLTRRRLILGGAAAAVLAAMGVPKIEVEGANPKKPEKHQEMTPTPEGLRGKKLGDLYTLYTGIRGDVPEKINADFPTIQLSKMWKHKGNRYEETPEVRETRETLLKSYNQERAEKMGWKEYRAQAQKSIERIRERLDWGKVGKEFGVKADASSLLRALEKEITGAHLISYCLTELMPGVDGKLNRTMLDFMLQQGGREYVESIPAMNDREVSFGPYQFTPYALKDPGPEKKKTGASIPNKYIQEAEKSFSERIIAKFVEHVKELLPEWEGITSLNEFVSKSERIPGSVAKLRGNDHHKAAYLFAIHNLALLVRSLSADDQQALVGRAKELRPAIAEYIATAHHLPSVARPCFKNYLAAVLNRDARPKPKPPKQNKNETSKGRGRDADYLEHISPLINTKGNTKGKLKAYKRLREYARKTRINYQTVVME